MERVGTPVCPYTLMAIAHEMLKGEPVEHAVVAYLNEDFSLRGFHTIAIGNESRVGFSTLDILPGFSEFEGATACVFIHNHPNDCPLPSSQDLQTFPMIACHMEIWGKRLLDCFIVADSGVYSWMFNEAYRADSLQAFMSKEAAHA